MAPIGGGQFITGKRLDIVVVRPSQDEDVPLDVRRALVGMVIPTIFSSEQLHGATPPGSRTAYGSEVAQALEDAGKTQEALQLAETLSSMDSKYSFLVFEDGTYEHYVKK